MQKDKEETAEIYTEEKCCICLEPLKVINTMIFPCHHKCVHVTCFVSSNPIPNKCPLCRMSLIVSSFGDSSGKEGCS